jgi:hypothetical protein
LDILAGWFSVLKSSLWKLTTHPEVFFGLKTE